MDPLSLAVGGVLLGVGMLAGRLMGRRARKLRRDPEPICGCEHHRSMHSPQTGECMVAVYRETWTPTGANIGRQPHDCPCQQYVGPEPISSLWSPPVLPEGSGR